MNVKSKAVVIVRWGRGRKCWETRCLAWVRIPAGSCKLRLKWQAARRNRFLRDFGLWDKGSRLRRPSRRRPWSCRLPSLSFMVYCLDFSLGNLQESFAKQWISVIFHWITSGLCFWAWWCGNTKNIVVLFVVRYLTCAMFNNECQVHLIDYAVFQYMEVDCSPPLCCFGLSN